MTYEKYYTALIEKRFWKFIGFHSVVVSKSTGWKVKVIGFVGWNKGVKNHG